MKDDNFYTNERYQKIAYLGNKKNVELMEDTYLNCRVVKKVQQSESAFEIYKKLLSQTMLHVAIITDCRKEDGIYYSYEKYIDGKTLTTIMEENGRLEEKRALKYAIQILTALSYLHEEGIIHKDISPNNIIIDRQDCVWITDFGISRRYNPTKAKDTQFYGTKEFASPEHYGFGQTDGRSDIYSVGKVLQYMVTGDDMSKKDKTKEISYPLLSVIEKSTRLEPMERYVSVEEMKSYLEEIFVINADAFCESKTEDEKHSLSLKSWWRSRCEKYPYLMKIADVFAFVVAWLVVVFMLFCLFGGIMTISEGQIVYGLLICVCSLLVCILVAPPMQVWIAKYKRLQWLVRHKALFLTILIFCLVVVMSLAA